MKTTRVAILCTTLMTLASTAFASSGGSTHSGILVWAFLGFFALIIAFQLVPALMVLLGMLKGVTERPENIQKSMN